MLWQNYVRNLINFNISVVGHLENFDKVAAYLEQGHNVIMLANHQTEADPGEKSAFVFCDILQTSEASAIRPPVCEVCLITDYEQCGAVHCFTLSCKRACPKGLRSRLLRGKVCQCAAVWALLLEKTHPQLASDVIYVAGDRVVMDPLCKPFSMGRNMFCVHSKKRMDDVPELKAEKQRTNRRTLSAMLKAFREVCLSFMWLPKPLCTMHADYWQR